MDYSDDCLQALGDLVDETADAYDADAESPIYSELRGLEARYCNPELIGTGGMKRIFSVMDKKSHRFVAMARLHEDASELLYDPFLREARLTALLEHPNVISVHDVGVDADGLPYFTMELQTGDGLDDVLQRAATGSGKSLTERLDIFLKVGDAVAFAHSRNVLHLDLKPANVQVGRYGEVIVCDWGLGKFIGAADGVDDDVLLNPDLLGGKTISGEIKGTPGYMAPEQILGNEKDERTDVYALGALLYATLACRPPLDGDTTAIMDATTLGRIASPTSLDKSIPCALSAVVMKAMAVIPQDRYQSVEAMQSDVRAYLNGFSPVAYRGGIAAELGMLYRRRQALCNAAAVFLLVLAVVTGAFVDRLNNERQRAVESALAAEASAEAARQAAKEARVLAERLQRERSQMEALVAQVGTVAYPSLNRPSRGDAGHQYSNQFFCLSPITSYQLGVAALEQLPPKRSNPAARSRLGILHFAAFNFARAQPLLVADPKLDHILAINNQALATFDVEAHRQSAKQLLRVLEALLAYRRVPLAEMVLSYDYATIGYRPGYVEAIELMLSVGSKKRDREAVFEYDRESKTLRLRGEQYSSLTTHGSISPLRFLDVEHLILEETGARIGPGLAGLASLRSIDLRKSGVVNIEYLLIQANLRKLIVRPDQFTEAQKARLSDRLSIEEGD